MKTITKVPVKTVTGGTTTTTTNTIAGGTIIRTGKTTRKRRRMIVVSLLSITLSLVLLLMRSLSSCCNKNNNNNNTKNFPLFQQNSPMLPYYNKLLLFHMIPSFSTFSFVSLKINPHKQPSSRSRELRQQQQQLSTRSKSLTSSTTTTTMYYDNHGQSFLRFKQEQQTRNTKEEEDIDFETYRSWRIQFVLIDTTNSNKNVQPMILGSRSLIGAFLFPDSTNKNIQYDLSQTGKKLSIVVQPRTSIIFPSLFSSSSSSFLNDNQDDQTKVIFNYNDGQYTRTEQSPPYALYTNQLINQQQKDEMIYEPFVSLSTIGTHTLSAQVYSSSSSSSNNGDTTSKPVLIASNRITFTVYDSRMEPTPPTPIPNPKPPVQVPKPVPKPIQSPVLKPIQSPVPKPIQSPPPPSKTPTKKPIDPPPPQSAPVQSAPPPVQSVPVPVQSAPPPVQSVPPPVNDMGIVTKPNILPSGEYSASMNGAITGTLQKWHKLTLGFTGPNTNENNSTHNPFLFYKVTVTFRHRITNTVYSVPGYYGADGKAAYTSANSGNVWLIHFTPDQLGIWEWTVSFIQGTNIAVRDTTTINEESAGYFDNKMGSFQITVNTITTNVRDHRVTGRLQYVEEHYLQFVEKPNDYFLKVGADSPENFLAYEDFDNTPNNKNRIKSWKAHIRDYNTTTDPYWGLNNQNDRKGQGILGAINYLANKGMNVFSFLTMNIIGDDTNVYPYVSDMDFQRFDVSKISQWEIVFEHADNLGMYLHFKTQETENSNLLDNGALGIDRKLYYRELIARFSHHLALNWNIGEENVNSNQQRQDFINYIHELDPYKHHIVIHTYPGDKEEVYAPLLGLETFTGVSMQGSPTNTVSETREWVQRSAESGHKWVVACDEQTTAQAGVVPDDVDPDHDTIRKGVLWGNLMNNGGGVEYYFGYDYPNSDLSCEDYRSRDRMWTLSKYALDFFHNFNIPFWTMSIATNLITDSTINSCMATPDKNQIILYLPDGGEESMKLGAVPTSTVYNVYWYDPLKGGTLQTGSVKTINGGGTKSIGEPPVSTNKKDWALFLRKI